MPQGAVLRRVLRVGNTHIRRFIYIVRRYKRADDSSVEGGGIPVIMKAARRTPARPAMRPPAAVRTTPAVLKAYAIKRASKDNISE